MAFLFAHLLHFCLHFEMLLLKGATEVNPSMQVWFKQLY